MVRTIKHLFGIIGMHCAYISYVQETYSHASVTFALEKRYNMPEKACASNHIASTTCRQNAQTHRTMATRIHTYTAALLGCHCHASVGKSLKKRKKQERQIVHSLRRMPLW